MFASNLCFVWFLFSSLFDYSKKKEEVLAKQIDMPPKTDNVQRLLQAEEKRNKIVADAKAEKLAKVRAAKVDAEKDVAEFRSQKNGELDQYSQQAELASAGERRQVEIETDAELVQVKRTAAERMDDVADLMVAMVCKVNA